MGYDRYCYDCVEMDAALSESEADLRDTKRELNAARTEIERLQEDNNAHMHSVHTLAMREHETMESLEQALEQPNLLRLVVQGLIFDYKGV